MEQQPASESAVGERVVRVQLESPPVFSLRLRPLPPLLQNVCQLDMCFRKCRIQFQRLLGRSYHLWTYLPGGNSDKNCGEIVVRACQADVCRCKRRVSLYRFLEITNT